MSLLIIGTMAFDAIETPYGKTDKIVGGAATFITMSASKFTNDLKVVSVVGGDFPKELINDWNKEGIGTEGIQIKEDEKSFFWSGKYHDNMNQRDTITTELNVLADFDPVIPESYTDIDYLMLGNLTPAIQQQVIDRLPSRPKFIALDTMNFWMDVAMDDLKAVIKNIDCLIINDEEARQLSGDYHLKTAAQTILGMGPSTLIIKKGEHGALLFQEDKIFFAPGLPLSEVFDPTGAGDTFAGGFMGHLASTEDISWDNLKRAIIYGSAMASYAVERFGTEKIEHLERSYLESRVQEFVALSKFDMV